MIPSSDATPQRFVHTGALRRIITRARASRYSIAAAVCVMAIVALPLVVVATPLPNYLVARGQDVIARIGFDVIRHPGPIEHPGFLVHNGIIGIKHNDGAKGFLMLYWYNQANGEWEVFNNIVPLVKAGWFTNNAEFQRPDVTAIVEKDDESYKRVRYEYSRFANGAQFSLIAELKEDEPYVRITVQPEPGTRPIEEFSLQSSLGFVDVITQVETDHAVYYASDYDVNDGYMRGGVWIEVPPDGRRLTLRGERLVQVQEIETDLRGGDRIEVEVRRTPWLRVLPHPEQNWFELVRIIRDPFSIDKAVWRFGIVPAEST